MKKLVVVALPVLAALTVGSGTVVAADLPSSLMEPYLLIHEGLAADKIDGLKANGGAIAREAAKMGPGGGKIQAASAKLVVAGNLQSARTAFGELSEAISAFANETNSSLGTDVHEVYCPMVKKPWLQKGRAIKNPYYGKSMLTCGEVKR